jgi:hypothetical protein
MGVLITWTERHLFRVWDARIGKLLRELTDKERILFAPCLTPDGGTLVSVAFDTHCRLLPTARRGVLPSTALKSIWLLETRVQEGFTNIAADAVDKAALSIATGNATLTGPRPRG